MSSERIKGLTGLVFPKMGSVDDNRVSGASQEETMESSPGLSQSNPRNGHPLVGLTDDEPSCVEDLVFDCLKKTKFAKRFVILPNSWKTDMARLANYSPSLRGTLPGCQEVSQHGSLRLKDIVSQSGLLSPDHSGWLTDLSCGKSRWCIIADMLLCVFDNEQQDQPCMVLMLPGLHIKSIRYMSAKRDILEAKVDKDNHHKQVCKTISGLHQYQILITNPATGKKHSFGASSVEDMDSWVSWLKVAANLDTSLFTNVAPGETESVQTNNAKANDVADAVSLQNKRRFEKNKSSSRSLSLHPKSKENRINDVNPIVMAHKTRHSSSCLAETVQEKKDKPQIKNFRNRQLTRHNSFSHLADLSPQSNGSIDGRTNGVFRKRIGSIPNLKSDLLQEISPKLGPWISPLALLHRLRRPNSDIVQDISGKVGELDGAVKSPCSPECIRKSASPQPGSDSEGSLSGISAQFVRRASLLKRKMFGKTKISSTSPNNKLGSLVNLQISGYLQHKSMLMWTKLWCVVCQGNFYGYKSNSAKELPELTLTLKECSVMFADIEKNKSFSFKLCRSNAKSIYLAAADAFDFQQWILVLKNETYRWDDAHSYLSPRPSTESVIDARSLQRSISSDSSKSSQSLRSLKSNTYSVHSLAEEEHVEHEEVACLHSSGGSKHFSKINGSSRSQIIGDKCTLNYPVPNISNEDFNPVSSWTEAYFRSASFTASIAGSQDGSASNSTTDADSDIAAFIADDEDEDDCDTDSVFASSHDLASSWTPNYTSLPVYDFHLKQVWNSDKNYQIQAEAAALASNLDLLNRDISGPDGSGVLLLGEYNGQTKLNPTTKYKQHEAKQPVKLKKRRSLSDGFISLPAFRQQMMALPKKARPVMPVAMAAREISKPVATAYLSKKSVDGVWESCWCVLKEDILYIYDAPIDDECEDTIRLVDYEVTMTHITKDGRHVIELQHADYITEMFAAESENVLELWLDKLQQASHLVATSSSTLQEPSDDNTSESCIGLEKAGLVGSKELLKYQKQLLLQEVLQQREDLERRMKAHGLKESRSADEEPSGHIDCSLIPPPVGFREQGNEQTLRNITRLKQRKISLELKVERLRKHAQFINSKQHKKKFRLGKSLKGDRMVKGTAGLPSECAMTDKETLRNQLRKLDSDLEAINKRLEQRYRRQKRHYSHDNPMYDEWEYSRSRPYKNRHRHASRSSLDSSLQALNESGLVYLSTTKRTTSNINLSSNLVPVPCTVKPVLKYTRSDSHPETSGVKFHSQFLSAANRNTYKHSESANFPHGFFSTFSNKDKSNPLYQSCDANLLRQLSSRAGLSIPMGSGLEYSNRNPKENVTKEVSAGAMAEIAAFEELIRENIVRKGST